MFMLCHHVKWVVTCPLVFRGGVVNETLRHDICTPTDDVLRDVVFVQLLAGSPQRAKYERLGSSLKWVFFLLLGGGGRIRDVASLIRRTDEPKIKKIFWGKKSK